MKLSISPFVFERGLCDSVFFLSIHSQLISVLLSLFVEFYISNINIPGCLRDPSLRAIPQLHLNGFFDLMRLSREQHSDDPDQTFGHYHTSQRPKFAQT